MAAIEMKKPVHPYIVLAIAIVFPGGGHVAIGQPMRGLTYIFFIALFAMLTYATTTPEHSFVGRHAGGLFIWALSILDAYRRARFAGSA